MRLLQAHEYLSRRLDLDRPGKLRTVVPQRPLEALNVLREKEIVAPHATRGLHVIAPHRFIGLTLTDANSTVAFCKKGVPTTVAEYYRSRNERLLWPHLPLLVVGAPAMVHRDYYPLEKLFLHECGRPCSCPTLVPPSPSRQPMPETPEGSSQAKPIGPQDPSPPAVQSSHGRAPTANFSALAERLRKAREEAQTRCRFIDESDLEDEHEDQLPAPPSSEASDTDYLVFDLEL